MADDEPRKALRSAWRSMLRFVFLLALLPGIAFPAAATLHRLMFGQWITLDIFSPGIQRVMIWVAILGAISFACIVAWGSANLRLPWHVPLLNALGMACVVAGWLALVAARPVPAVSVCFSGGLMVLASRRVARLDEIDERRDGQALPCSRDSRP
ncbi:MAG: hypothetical protein GF393_03080 [Armatimonadia bacterium]|nr:hypothetical protein [Armatimonadia bacterium]